MTHLDYANWVPLPAPVTSGGVQSFTDPIGDVWVAYPSSYGGNWKRARDVLNCQWVRTAALTFPGAYTTLPWDTSVWDPYGLYSTGTSHFTLPIAGLWRFSQTLSASCYGNGYMDSCINVVSGGIAGQGVTFQNTAANGATAQNISASVTVLLKFTAGAVVQSYSAASGSLAMQTPALGVVPNFICIDYLGTG